MRSLFAIPGLMIGDRVRFLAYQDTGEANPDWSEGVVFGIFQMTQDDYLIEVKPLFDRRSQLRWQDEVELIERVVTTPGDEEEVE